MRASSTRGNAEEFIEGENAGLATFPTWEAVLELPSTCRKECGKVWAYDFPNLNKTSGMHTFCSLVEFRRARVIGAGLGLIREGLTTALVYAFGGHGGLIKGSEMHLKRVQDLKQKFQWPVDSARVTELTVL